MAYRLQMNGGTDNVKVPSITFTKVILDIKVPRNTSATRHYFDFRTGFSFGYLQSTTGGVDSEANDTPMSTYIDGVGPKTNNTVMVPDNVRCLLETRWASAGTDDGNIFSNTSGSVGQIGDIYDVKFYNSTTLVAHYDMTLGNVQDQSGNGYHATLTGGTWINEGGGEHPVTASASAVFSASVTVVKGRAITATASAATTAAVTTVRDRSLAATAQATFSASATVVKGSSGEHAISAAASFVTSAAVTTVRKVYSLAAASFATTASVTLTKKISVTAAAITNFTVSLFQGAAIIDDDPLNAVRDLYGSLAATRDINGNLQATRSLYGQLRGDLVTATNQDIDAYIGESKIRTVTVREEAGETVNLTGSTLVWTVEKNGTVIFTKAPPLGTNNYECVLNLLPADTATLAPGIYDHIVGMTDVLGNHSRILTGKLRLK